ncbi:two pore domain potassium channel family protein [Streptomyces sp. SID7813]|uniref:Membrane protein n=1 Tax=Streptomyces coelicolor (strain ATCC BAA-471 / A3(2) / M145) TaxID=100226 RepID=O54192_STRCO|nr:two pore domain potassium channel family protein [Streptomyces sp. SID7813]QFI45806.1 two pore domain potassium channel family protein [Streptomyces coelicolor A3(2)]TYP09472.1 ion channel [Streptomyces coelicolor]TYP13426.1 ion channel [Streptomyces coelicolor A3(2)]TYP32192.1 ion channel [Streptomyces coelicolor]
MKDRRTAHPRPRPRTPPRRRTGWDAVGPWVVRAGIAAAVVVAYFLLPLDHLGPQRPVLSWVLFALLLTVVAVLLLRQIRHVLLDRPDSRPGVVISLLIVLSVHVFSAAYYALAKSPGEFNGLHTRIDALYFTVVTLATVGYGDITPRGQAARVVTVLQITYSFVFLTAAATALTTRMRDRVVRGPQRGRSR